MAETAGNPWIHIGECPVCVDGLCRVRTCGTNDQQHFFAMCDECEALWLVPSTNTPRTFPDATDPVCPVCSLPLYGPQSHWSHLQELTGTQWMENVIVDVPTDIELASDGLASKQHGQHGDVSSSLDQSNDPNSDDRDDSSYGQAAPKPGC